MYAAHLPFSVLTMSCKPPLYGLGFSTFDIGITTAVGSVLLLVYNLVGYQMLEAKLRPLGCFQFGTAANLSSKAYLLLTLQRLRCRHTSTRDLSIRLVLASIRQDAALLGHALCDVYGVHFNQHVLHERFHFGTVAIFALL